MHPLTAFAADVGKRRARRSHAAHAYTHLRALAVDERRSVLGVLLPRQPQLVERPEAAEDGPP